MKITYKYSNRKTLALQVLDGIVIVRAPYGTPQFHIDKFVASKQSWLKKRLAMHQPLGYTGQSQLKVFGVTYKVEKKHADQFSIRFQEDSLMIGVPENKEDKWVSDTIDSKFKADLNDVLSDYLEKYCNLLRIKMPAFKIRKYKRLYGRCSRTGELAFNTYLYHESLEFIEYVVVHELAHLFEFNHSSRFYDVVASMMPHYKEVLKRKKLEKTHP